MPRTSFAAAAALFCWLTFLAYVLPYDPDEAVYKIVATGILDGRWPYRDLFDDKTPLIYLWYLPAGLGGSIELQRTIAAAATAASVPVFAAIAGRWLDGRQAALALAAYVLLLANPFLAVGANSEAFVLLFLTGAIAVPSAATAGLLLGIALMTKLHALIFAPVLVLLWKRDSWRLLVATAAVCVVTMAPFVLVWRDFWDSTISFYLEFGRYTADGRSDALLSLNEGVVLGGLPICFAAAIGLLRVREPLILLWAACGVVSLKATGFDFSHYYVLLIPPAALMAGNGLDYLLRHRVYRILLAPMISLAIITFSFGIILSVRDRNDYKAIAEAIASNDGELYVLGDRVQIYVQAGRQPRRRFFFTVPLVINRDWSAETRERLIACPPAVLVVPDHGVFRVAWESDVEGLYTHRQVFDAGTVLTEPRKQCSIH